LRDRLLLTEREINALRLENAELSICSNCDCFIKELERITKENKDNSTKLIIKQTQLEQIEISFTNHKKLTESIRNKLDEISVQ
jgi:hypothetical protein